MDEFIRSGLIADVILVAIAAEIAIVGFYLWRRGQGLALMSFVASGLAAGRWSSPSGRCCASRDGSLSQSTSRRPSLRILPTSP
jgi:hypothetical protein